MVPNFHADGGPCAAAFRRDGEGVARLFLPRASRADAGQGRWRIDTGRTRTPDVAAHEADCDICNPNNPTGARFEAAELDRIAAIRPSRQRLLDRVRRDLSRRGNGNGRETPTIWSRSTPGDRHQRVCRKPMGCRAWRIGWIVGPPSRVASLWSYHDYTTIRARAR